MCQIFSFRFIQHLNVLNKNFDLLFLKKKFKAFHSSLSFKKLDFGFLKITFHSPILTSNIFLRDQPYLEPCLDSAKIYWSDSIESKYGPLSYDFYKIYTALVKELSAFKYIFQGILYKILLRSFPKQLYKVIPL